MRITSPGWHWQRRLPLLALKPTTAKRLMENRHYLGDDFCPAIIDQETFDKVAAIRLERAGKLGRLNRKKNSKPTASPTGFRMATAEQHYEDPRLQAEYLYSLIESEVS